MPREFSRSERVAEQMQRDIAQLLQREIQDPRLSSITVSGVDVSRDLEYAKVFVSTFDESPDIQAIEAALNRACGFIRSQLSRSMKMRSVPHLQFKYDTSMIDGEKLAALIDKANKSQDEQ